MKKYVIASCILATGALLGCGDKNAASESSFKAALSPAVAVKRLCVVDDRLGAAGVDLSKGEGIPYFGNEKSEDKIMASSPLFSILSGLQTMGLLKTKLIHKKQPGLMGDSYDLISVGADLTEEGKKHFRMVAGYPGFCFGGAAIDSITEFTPPAPDSTGVTVSHVNFTAHYTDFPDLSHVFPEKSDAFTKEANAPHLGHAVLAQTNKGWTVQSLQIQPAQ